MTQFVETKRARVISEKLVHVPLSGTIQVALLKPFDTNGGALQIKVDPLGICSVVDSSLRGDRRVLTLRGMKMGEAILSARTATGALKDYVSLHVHLPRIRQLPDYDKLSLYYAGSEETSPAFRQRIGGAVDSPRLANTCTMRLSEAFNKAGHRIPHGLADLATKKGADGHHYAIRVAEFRKYMIRTFGSPDIVRYPRPPLIRNVEQDDFADLAGVICFEANFGDATGHFTLWNGQRAVHGDYFEGTFGLAVDGGVDGAILICHRRSSRSTSSKPGERAGTSRPRRPPANTETAQSRTTSGPPTATWPTPMVA